MPISNCFQGLFQPGRLGSLHIKNRIVQLPSGTSFIGPNCEVTERTIASYVEGAKGGVGLITVGGVRPYSVSRPNDRKFLNLADERLLPSHQYLVEAVHSYGTKIAVQLNHPGPQVFAADWAGEQPLSPSGVQQIHISGSPYARPRAMGGKEVYQMIEQFVKAILNARQVGYDIVEIHAGHGHLLGSFLSPATNRRGDNFGGSLQNRVRFVTEIIEQANRAVGDDFPIGVRISGDEFLPDGITIEESPAIAKALELAGAQYISISCGTYLNQHKISDVMRMEEGWKIPIWLAIKEAIGIPTIVGGGNRNPGFCEKLILDGKTDFVGLARQMQADPYWPRKAAAGRIDDINRCISCLRCLYTLDGKPPVVKQCSVNPLWGREIDFIHVHPPAVNKKVLIIGGGPAGMEAARVASMRGHEVTLCEKGPELGGQLLLASLAPGKTKVKWFRDYLVAQLTRQGVNTMLNVDVTPDFVEQMNPDVVIIATGATPLVADIPGIKNAKATTAWDILKGVVKPKEPNILIIGGGAVGCETAEHLAKQGKKVTVIEMLPKIAHNMEPLNRYALMQELKELEVTLLVSQKAVQVHKTAVDIRDILTQEKQSIQYGHLVLALGAKTEDSLAKRLTTDPRQVHVIGDCTKPQTILEAVRDAFLITSRI